jgi:RNA polymerase sigma-70 factor (ECF subfamily)
MAHKTLETKAQNSPGAPDFNALLQDVAKRRDRESFVRLFEHFAPRIKSFLMKGGMNPEAADELAQETMLTVWNKAENFDPARASASTWIFTIARNKKIDSLRRIARDPSVQEADFTHDIFADETPGPSDQLARAQETEMIAQALATLPQEQADLIYKSFFEGKSHAEIAEETKIPLGTIKSRIRLALERLRGQNTMKELR